MEPLKELALFAYYWADRTCADACRQYHKNWSVIRYLDLDSQLPHHADYFIEQIKRYGQNKKAISILISGSADTGLLTVVLEGIKDLDSFVEITLIDRCQTVLLQNQLFAQFNHLTIKTIQTDIFELHQGEFDLILAHSFINFFEDHQHQKLFHQWHSLLKSGGQLLINNKSIVENLDSRIISDTAIEKKLRAIQKRIEVEALPITILNSIKDFWSNQPKRHQIKHENLLLIIAACGFQINDYTMIDQDGAGPIAGRYESKKRITNLMSLKK